MPKKQKLTLAAFDANGVRRSLFWRFIVRGSDLMVGAQGMRQHKYTFHASGICHSAFTREYFTPEVEAAIGSARTGDRWVRPTTPAAGTTVHVFSIIIAGQDPESDDQVERSIVDPEIPTVCLAAPAFPNTIELQVHYSAGPPENLSAAPFRLVGWLPLTSGEHVHLAAIDAPPIPASLRQSIPPVLHGRLLPGSVLPADGRLRGFAYGVRPDGVRCVIDLPARLAG